MYVIKNLSGTAPDNYIAIHGTETPWASLMTATKYETISDLLQAVSATGHKWYGKFVIEEVEEEYKPWKVIKEIK